MTTTVYCYCCPWLLQLQGAIWAERIRVPSLDVGPCKACYHREIVIVLFVTVSNNTYNSTIQTAKSLNQTHVNQMMVYHHDSQFRGIHSCILFIKGDTHRHFEAVYSLDTLLYSLGRKKLSDTHSRFSVSSPLLKIVDVTMCSKQPRENRVHRSCWIHPDIWLVSSTTYIISGTLQLFGKTTPTSYGLSTYKFDMFSYWVI